MSLRGAMALCGLAFLLPAFAGEPAHPDLSGFWMPVRERFEPDPELVKHVPAGTAVMQDTGAAEFGKMEFGGLKPRPAALEAARAWDPRQEMTVSNACKAPSIVYALQGPFPIEIFQGRSMHPENLSRGSLGAGMGRPFLLGNLTFFVAFVYCLVLRWEVEIRRARLALRAENLAGSASP